MRLKDKVAIITGAGQGIGEQIALTFGREGAKVVVADIHEENGKQVEQALHKQNIEAIFVRTDVSNEADVIALIRKTKETFGGLHIHVNNAAINTRKSAMETSLEQWNQIINVNLTGAFLCSKYAVPLLEQSGGGAIINVASWHADKTVSRLAAYAAAKGGMTALTRQMAIDCGPKNIRVNAVSPSTVDTAMLRGTFEDYDDPEEAYKQLLDFQPLGRIGTTEDIANACLYLASDESSYVSGHTLMVDGGTFSKIARPTMFD